MIGVVIPVHNEEARLAACLESVLAAADHPGLGTEQVAVWVVVDSCTDRSEEIARARGVGVIEIRALNVGEARAVGAGRALAAGADWIAFTDADSRVAADWLVEQCRLEADAVCGTVEVESWAQYAPAVRTRYDAAYEDRDGHRHVHGANLGVSAMAYRRVGGMPPLRESEDVAFVRALIRSGVEIAWSARPRVVTSARRVNRVDGGFSGFLRQLESAVAG